MSAKRPSEVQPWIPRHEQADAEERLARKSAKLAGCTSEFIKTLLAIRITGDSPDAEIIWNAACHVNMISHDQNVLVYFMATTSDNWARRAIARMLITVMFEGCDDLLKIYGKEFMDACERLKIWKGLEVEFKSIKKKLSRFFNAYSEKWKLVRHNAAAHKDHDALTVLRSIAGISPDDTLSEACALEEILRSIGAFSARTISLAHKELRRRGVLR